MFHKHRKSRFSSELGIIEEEKERYRGTPNNPQMHREKWKITKCLECGHIETKELLNREKFN